MYILTKGESGNILMLLISSIDIKEVKNMPREQFQNLTEPMYYILISLLTEKCGVDIMEDVIKISNGRVKVGPGTLYTLLGKFEAEDIIRETGVQGRKRSYIITNKGRSILQEEYKRLKMLVKDGEGYIGEEL
jgi:DNA-binding PadR family transcriptional regulator